MAKYKVGDKFTHCYEPGFIATITSIDEGVYHIHWTAIPDYEFDDGIETEDCDSSHNFESIENNSATWQFLGSSLELFVREKLATLGIKI